MRPFFTAARQAALVAVAGVAFGLIANAVSPRGLKLQRDYFPPLKLAATPGDSPKAQPALTAPPPETPSQFPAVSRTDLEAYLKDPSFEQGISVLVDVRSQNHFAEGHIAGAHLFDRFNPDLYLSAVLPVLLNAQRIVFYCNGGACEDSEYAAVFFQQSGIPAERISIYRGGIQEWMKSGLPVEIGERNSGLLRQPKP